MEDKKQMVKLKPCPFCGCDMSKVYAYDPYDGYQGNNVRHIIACLDCSAKITERTFEQAVDAWNRRAEEDEWEWIEDHGDIVCENCRATYNDEIVCMNRDRKFEDLKYCPNCGVPMRTERNDNG